jgi:hypothetical protein
LSTANWQVKIKNKKNLTLVLPKYYITLEYLTTLEKQEQKMILADKNKTFAEIYALLCTLILFFIKKIKNQGKKAPPPPPENIRREYYRFRQEKISCLRIFFAQKNYRVLLPSGSAARGEKYFCSRYFTAVKLTAAFAGGFGFCAVAQSKKTDACVNRATHIQKKFTFAQTAQLTIKKNPYLRKLRNEPPKIFYTCAVLRNPHSKKIDVCASLQTHTFKKFYTCANFLNRNLKKLSALLYNLTLKRSFCYENQ